MEQIINGATLGSYITTAMSLGQAKKPNMNGVMSRFVVLTMVDKGSPFISKKRRHIIFDEDAPGLIDMLKPFASTIQNATTGGYDVDLKALRNSEDFSLLEGIMEFQGGMVAEYKFDCPRYQNDIDGNMLKDRFGNPIIRKSCTVFVQVKSITTGPDGLPQYNYYDGLGLSQVGERYVTRFFMRPVENVQTTQTAEVDPFTTAQPEPQQSAQAAPQQTVQPQAAGQNPPF